MSYADVLDILYEDNHLLAVNKPSGWPSAHFDGNDQTMDQVAKEYLREKYQKPGNVFLGVVHRLDKPVSGCLLFARTSKAASRLSEQFRESAVEKVYWAVIEAKSQNRLWEAGSGSFDDWLWHDDAGHQVRVVDPGTAGAKPARLLWTARARHRDLVLLELRPHTGRKHQLRVQLASRGMPIYGDKKYGSAVSFGDGIGLHARSLGFLHPTRTEPIQIKAEVPLTWRGRFAHLLTEGATG